MHSRPPSEGCCHLCLDVRPVIVEANFGHGFRHSVACRRREFVEASGEEVPHEGAPTGAASSSSGAVQEFPIYTPKKEEDENMRNTRGRSPGEDTPVKPPAQKVRVEAVSTDPAVQDLQNVDESLEAEAADSTIWFMMGKELKRTLSIQKKKKLS